MSASSSPLSSGLSSIGSSSPSPPADYPTPPPTYTPIMKAMSLGRDSQTSTSDREGPPPAKRRRTIKPREKKTERLDLQALNESDDEMHHKTQDSKLSRLITALRTKRKIVVIAGAGISVSAGIPDFRSSDGLFNNLRTEHKLKGSGKHLFDASVYRDDKSTGLFHDMLRKLAQQTQEAQPTAFHHMLATLAEEGRLLRLYTQNVDGIDVSLEPLKTTIPLNRKGPWPKTIQLHGSLSKMVCQKCGHLANMDASLFEGSEAPLCPECEIMDTVRTVSKMRRLGIGRLRPRMVLYNEYNPDEDAIGACSHADIKTKPDAVIVVGTSLKIPGIRRLTKELCSVTRDRRGGFTAWINHDSEPKGVEFEDCWDMVVQGECDDVARLVGLPKWDDKDCGEYTLLSKEEKRPKDSRPQVIVESKHIDALKLDGILTPGGSPRHTTPELPAPCNSLPKLKQPQLKFGEIKPVLAQKEVAPKKKRGRKPLPNGPTKPVNKITNKFSATKSTKSMSSKVEKLSNTHPITPSGARPSQLKENAPVARTNEASSGIDSESLKLSTVTVEVPPYGETISPGSVPRGMVNLFT